jgi:ribosomal protein S12 methylthiotransferase
MTGKLAVISLGCAKNLVDAEAAVGALVAAGYELTAEEEEADVILVNTCAFIGPAREEARAVLAEVSEQLRPEAVLAVTGCFPQLAAEELASEFARADVILGVNAAAEVAEAVGEARSGGRVIRVEPPRPPLAGLAERPRLTLPHASFLKIAEGCDHPCSFCTVPRLRGRYRSRPPADVLREAELAAARDVAELTLLAQDTSRYGADLQEDTNLAALLRDLASVGVPWIRVLYLHPERLTDELAATFAELPTVVNYFDVPLQHASPRLLEAMGRPAWTPEDTLARLARVREIVPGAAFRTSLLVGFPGETEADVNLLADFLTEARLDHVGVFTFSPEEGTPAAALPERPPPAEAEGRRESLMLLQQEIVAARYQELVGARYEVLVDRVAPEGPAVGRTYFQGPEGDPVTIVAAAGDVRPGQFVAAELTGNDGYELLARRAEENRGA